MSFDELAALWFGRAAVIFTAAAALAGMFTWIFSNRVSDAKDSALSAFQRDSKLAIATADARAAEANLVAAQADEKAAALRHETAVLQADNLSLQTVMARRHVGVIGIDGPPKAATWFAETKAFAGTRVLIQVAPDAEARNLADEIVIALTRVGGWNAEFIDFQRSLVPAGSIGEGVHVAYATGKPWTAEEPNQPWFAWAKAAEALARALTNAGLGVGDLPVTSAGLTNDEKNPSFMLPYFRPPLTGVYRQVGERPVDLTLQWMEQRRAAKTPTP